MVPSATMFLSRTDVLLALAHAAIVMIAAVLTVAALVRGGHSGLWQSAGIAFPILAGSLGAYRAGGIASALTLMIGASVCAMLFCNGAAMLVAGSKEGDPPPAGALASLIFPIGIVLLLSGFAAHSTAAGLVGLAIVGVLAMDMGRGEPGLASVPGSPGGIGARVLASAIALLASGVLAFSAVALLSGLGNGLPLVRSDAFLILFVTPAVTLPLLVHTTRLASGANLAAATRLTATVVCLLLGIALPAFIGVDYFLAARENDIAQPAGLPPVSWRLDSPLLIMAGFGMLGLRLGFLRPDRWVALLFVLIYVLYILTGTVMRIG